MLRIDQAGKGLRIALLAHMPIGCPAKLPPTRVLTGLGHAREPEINAISQYRSEESLPILGWCLCAEMHESIAHTRPLVDLGDWRQLELPAVLPHEGMLPKRKCRFGFRQGHSVPELNSTLDLCHIHS